MKFSLRLPEDDVLYVDDYASRQGMSSRSADVHHAVEFLQASELETAYETAWDEWYISEDAHLWESTVGDGIADAPW